LVNPPEEYAFSFSTPSGAPPLEQLAVVYVRQSSMQQVLHQVLHHQESTQIQYGLVAVAERFWAGRVSVSSSRR
jgi:hypothetical protein